MKDGETVGWSDMYVTSCLYGNEEENRVVDNVEGVRVLYYPIWLYMSP